MHYLKKVGLFCGNMSLIADSNLSFLKEEDGGVYYTDTVVFGPVLTVSALIQNNWSTIDRSSFDH